VVLAGYQLDPDISSEIEALQKNLTMYRRLGVYTWLSQRSLWIFATIWTLVLALVSFGLAYVVSRDTPGRFLSCAPRWSGFRRRSE